MSDLRATILGIIQAGKASAGVMCGEPICQPCEDESETLVALFPVIDDAMVERFLTAADAEWDAENNGTWSERRVKAARSGLASALGVAK